MDLAASTCFYSISAFHFKIAINSLSRTPQDHGSLRFGDASTWIFAAYHHDSFVAEHMLCVCKMGWGDFSDASIQDIRWVFVALHCHGNKTGWPCVSSGVACAPPPPRLDVHSWQHLEKH